MLTFIGGAIVGALVLYLVFDNNPKLVAKLKPFKELLEKQIEDKLGKDI